MRTSHSATPVDADLVPYSSILDADGKPTLSVHVAHPHGTVFSHYAAEDLGIETTLGQPLNKDTREAVFISAASFLVGDIIDMQLTSHIHHYRVIIAISGNNVTLNATADTDFPSGSRMAKANFNMAVDGSVTPRIFKIPVMSTEFLHLETITLTSTHTAEGDDSKFCGIDLPAPVDQKGLHIRANRNNGESYDTVAIWLSNQQMRDDMGGTLVYGEAAPAGLKSTVGEYEFYRKSGAVELLRGSNNDSLEFVVRSDYSGLSSLLFKVHGH